MKRALALVIVAATALLFYAVVASSLNGIIKFMAVAGVLGVCGTALQKLYGFEGGWGMLLVRGKNGLKLIDSIAKWRPEIWKFLADFGLVFGYGVLGKILFKKVSWKTTAFSLAALALSSLFVLPSTLPIAFSVIAFPTGFGTITRQAGSGGEGSLIMYAVLALILVGGFATATIAGLVFNAGMIAFSIVRSLMGEGTALAKTYPGASFIIPGINLPLVEGVLALAVLLVVHEMAHGILARVGKIKLQSAGLVFFGIIPIGAFVDPDEKQLQKQNQEKQSRVLVAGSTANFIASILFFFLLIAFMSVAQAAFQEDKIIVLKSYTKNSLSEGTWIKAINGTNVTGLDSYYAARKNIGANQTFAVTTEKGDLEAHTDENGNVGVLLGPAVKPGWGWIWFVYNFLALTFVLNFLVGSVNLLPIPAFDGFRLADIALKNETAVKVLGAIVAASFLANFLPWIWN